MTITELQIQFDLNPDNRIDVLENADTCQLIDYGYLFVDQDDGQCYLFNKNGQEDDISKVKKIRDWSFSDYMSLTNIKIPDSVKKIERYAFWNCRFLKKIKIPDSVEWIEDWVFEDCRSLISIKIPSSVESIGHYIFHKCSSLKEVVFKGKTIDEVKAMYGYPWGIENESVIKVKS